MPKSQSGDSNIFTDQEKAWIAMALGVPFRTESELDKERGVFILRFIPRVAYDVRVVDSRIIVFQASPG